MFQEKKRQADLEMFVIYDSKVGVYWKPTLAINRHDVERQIADMFLDPQQATSQLVANAEDFSLIKVGEYNRQTGIVTPCTHEHIANLRDIRTASEQRKVQRPQASQLGVVQ